IVHAKFRLACVSGEVALQAKVFRLRRSGRRVVLGKPNREDTLQRLPIRLEPFLFSHLSKISKSRKWPLSTAFHIVNIKLFEAGRKLSTGLDYDRI
uniref:hypothetical protein n=1 Tax=uncultured Rhizobium sp. TaxID=155567 RepID=UPI0026367644